MKYFLLIAIVLSVSVSSAQDDSTHIDLSKYQKVYMDSGWVFVLKDLEKKEQDFYYHSYKRRVKKMYPFAKYAVELLTSLDDDLTDDEISKSAKKDAKKANKQLKEDFRQTILDMSQKDGAVLCKLIHRETGMTAYDIIKDYRGNLKALYWQSLAKLGGADLKQTFDPNVDLALNRVMKDVDSGKISIPSEPKLITKEERKAKKRR